MRRLFLLFFAVGFLGALGGCYHTHIAGLCDCDQEDQCYTRAPWVRMSTTTVNTAPAKVMPKGGLE